MKNEKENLQKNIWVCQAEKPNKEKCGHTMCMFLKTGQGIIVDIFVMSISLHHFVAKKNIFGCIYQF